MSDFKLGELVWVGRVGRHQDCMAVVIPQPEKFRHYEPAKFVWLRFLHNGFEDGVNPKFLTKAEEQTDAES